MFFTTDMDAPVVQIAINSSNPGKATMVASGAVNRSMCGNYRCYINHYPSQFCGVCFATK